MLPTFYVPFSKYQEAAIMAERWVLRSSVEGFGTLASPLPGCGRHGQTCLTIGLLTSMKAGWKEIIIIIQYLFPRAAMRIWSNVGPDRYQINSNLSFSPASRFTHIHLHPLPRVSSFFLSKHPCGSWPTIPFELCFGFYTTAFLTTK